MRSCWVHLWSVIGQLLVKNHSYSFEMDRMSIPALDLDGPCSRHLIAILVLWMDTVIHQWNIVKPIHEHTQIPKLKCHVFQLDCKIWEYWTNHGPWSNLQFLLYQHVATSMVGFNGQVTSIYKNHHYHQPLGPTAKTLRCDGTTWLWRPASCLQAGLVLTRANQVIPRRWENVSVKSHIFNHDLSIDLSQNIYP